MICFPHNLKLCSSKKICYNSVQTLHESSFSEYPEKPRFHPPGWWKTMGIKKRGRPQAPVFRAFPHPHAGERANGDQVDNQNGTPISPSAGSKTCIPPRAPAMHTANSIAIGCAAPGGNRPFPRFFPGFSQDHPPGGGAKNPVTARGFGVIHTFHRPYYYYDLLYSAATAERT